MDENKIQVTDGTCRKDVLDFPPSSPKLSAGAAGGTAVDAVATLKSNVNPRTKLKLFPVPSKEQCVLRDHSNQQQQSAAAAAADGAVATSQSTPRSSSGFLSSPPPPPPSSPLVSQRGLPSDYQAFIHTSRYARWVEFKRRRETWPETVGRYLDFMTQHLHDTCSYDMPAELRAELSEAIINLEVMPSMRSMMTAGEALSRCHVAGYNCSYLPIDHPFAFDEALFVLMNGTGVGYSVERQQVDQLPAVAERFVNSSSTLVVVEDSREGWARALREVLGQLWIGQVPRWDTSRLRPKGTRLKTFGGRASGPEPLEALFLFAVQLFQKARGRKLSPLECHDLICKVAEIVVVGGVRRSALISLSDLDDDALRGAKTGAWWEDHPHRAMANNSAVYTEGVPPVGVFMSEWKALYDSGSGERGLFSRAACRRQVLRNGGGGRRDPGFEFGTNPCSEIILRPYQFCNLTEVVVRSYDDATSLARKVRLAALLGTFQSTLTNLPYLREVWRVNTEQERLLGVSLTGIMDNTLTSGRRGTELLGPLLTALRSEAVAANVDMAAQLGIPASAAVTCVKPSGTVSQLVDAASGIHPRHAKYYIRRVRCNKDDPLTAFLKSNGVPYEDCVLRPDSTTIFSFPIKAPEGAVTRDDVSALSQLELCLSYQRYWCEHKPSITVTVREGEWMEVGAWVYKHFDELSGVSFLPYDCGSYKQMPYETVDEQTYNELAARMPSALNWSLLRELERGPGADEKMEAELACTAGGCEMVDIA
ncbi:hypothetical protein VOLCADRAFT_96647 [Volvox carteri f. nagariensis]|uniref:B12-dependent ribonucleotide reductase insertion domain-containing protein n=1 Tax=Volvox carteri f. nagariensis TaxID=3068 RepID=D8UAN9_VOLCA|nr:uncharacterized protein VOLCADRAFT_96647 [Volvox carteri f. nagariensis]EFJ43138.1 hypothetical protein VOLCADRAFT_96647 [Volvox carteri f. nagariensis]|eukprot:XP_002955713.1 hypothetical protein VOLCADRAFT_96647 [Volvox carteri f. nagariensis]